MDVLLKCLEWLVEGNPGFRGQACLAFGRKTWFLVLDNGATVESRNWCSNSATHPKDHRRRKNRKRLPIAKDLSMGVLTFSGPDSFTSAVGPVVILLLDNHLQDRHQAAQWYDPPAQLYFHHAPSSVWALYTFQAMSGSSYPLCTKVTVTRRQHSDCFLHSHSILQHHQKTSLIESPRLKNNAIIFTTTTPPHSHKNCVLPSKTLYY